MIATPLHMSPDQLSAYVAWLTTVARRARGRLREIENAIANEQADFRVNRQRGLE